jgi:hypothetical protein
MVFEVSGPVFMNSKKNYHLVVSPKEIAIN